MTTTTKTKQNKKDLCRSVFFFVLVSYAILTLRCLPPPTVPQYARQDPVLLYIETHNLYFSLLAKDIT